MSSYESFDQQIDCRGMQCPAPILKTAKAARALGGREAILKILADDEAFPMDLESWCKSSNATLLKLDRQGSTYQASVRVSGSNPRIKQPAPPVTPVAQSAAAPVADAASEQVERFDCRGMQCPAPILKIARAARTMPPDHTFEVLADDDAFPEDIKSWCNSANATLLSLSDREGFHRARIMRSALPSPTRAAEPSQPRIQAELRSTLKAPPAMADAPSASAQPSAPAPQAAPAQPAPQAAPAMPALRVALSGLTIEEAMARLDVVIHAYQPGEQVAMESADADFAPMFMRWCSERAHTLLQLDTRVRPARAELIIGAAHAPTQHTTALVPQEQKQKRCTLLILHNDFEALMAALLVANGAAAQGMEVTIFFSFWGLNLLRGETLELELAASKRGWFGNMIAKLMPSSRPRGTTRISLAQRMFKRLMPSGPRAQALGQLNFAGMGSAMLQQIMREQNVMSLPEMLAAAVEQDVRFIVCTMSMGVMGITKEDLMPMPNMVYGGVASFVEDAGRADMSLVF
jgi:TusA-related sulfurtransferase/peroxiredoxin family protein